MRGYSGTSIAAVSKASGLPPSSIYWHFTDKDDLLAAVIERSYGAWVAAATAPVAGAAAASAFGVAAAPVSGVPAAPAMPAASSASPAATAARRRNRRPFPSGFI